jgi:hypothetical protein
MTSITLTEYHIILGISPNLGYENETFQSSQFHGRSLWKPCCTVVASTGPGAKRISSGYRWIRLRIPGRKVDTAGSFGSGAFQIKTEGSPNKNANSNGLIRPAAF